MFMYGQVSLGMKKGNIVTILKEGDKQTTVLFHFYQCNKIIERLLYNA